MRAVEALTYFPPGILPFIASFLERQSILVAGGTGQNYFPMADASLNTCTSRTIVASMSVHRQLAAAVAIGDRIMVLGGYAGGDNLASCEAFDLDTIAWSALPSMQTPRYGACAIDWRGTAFIFGGIHGRVLSSAECFDSKLNRWSAIAPMITPRGFAAAVAVAGRGVLVMGGHNRNESLQSAELYDPVTDKWTTMSWQLPKPLHGFAAQCVDGVLHIFGGVSRLDGTSECWSMNLHAAAPVWSPLPPMPITRAGHVASVALRFS